MKRWDALLLCLGVLPAHAETLTLQGLGSVRIGMTLAQTERALGRKIRIDENVSGDASGCAQANWPGRDGVTFMFQKYHLTRLDIWKDQITTAEGAGIGTGEAQLRALYGRRAVFTDHPYLEKEGHYVTVRYPQQNRKLLFETADGKVTSFRIGYPKSVEYIEGCL